MIAGVEGAVLVGGFVVGREGERSSVLPESGGRQLRVRKPSFRLPQPISDDDLRGVEVRSRSVRGLWCDDVRPVVVLWGGWRSRPGVDEINGVPVICDSALAKGMDSLSTDGAHQVRRPAIESRATR